MTDPVFARSEWIERMPFLELDDEQVMREVCNRVTAAKTHGKRPVVVFDLDSTLYEVRSRTQKILEDWAVSLDSQPYPKVRTLFRGLTLNHFGYSIRDTFQNLGLKTDRSENSVLFDEVKRFWSQKFFSNDYLFADYLYTGAAEWVIEIYRLGADLVYLTGRDEPQMGDGTRKNLIRDRLPWATDRVQLYMKPAFEIPDLVHKKQAVDWIHGRGLTVASFENEPPNVIALADAFPDAMNIFVDTICSDHSAPLRSGLYKIQGFERKI